MKTITKIIYKITTIFKRFDIISQITIIYSSTFTILYITIGKIITNYTPLIRLCIQLGVLTFSAYFCEFTIEDICNLYNNEINQKSERDLQEIIGKIFDEQYLPHLDNKSENLTRIRQEFMESNFNMKNRQIIEEMENDKKLVPNDFSSSKNILIALTTAAIIIYFYK